MPATPLLGDYDCELVVLTLKGRKTGVDINPTQFGAEERVTVGARTVAEDVEGQGGGAVISRTHSRITDKTLTLLGTDPANAQFDQAILDTEVFDYTIVDNSGTNSKVKGVCWLSQSAPYTKSRTATEIQWTFRTWVQDMQHGQHTIIATG